MNKNYDYKILTPFKWFVLQNFPFIDEDFDAITNYQLFCKLGEEINKLINSMNQAGTQVEELTDYVNYYFENLDVQEEINNKLDEMAESGELADIIAQYLQVSCILAYDTKADMVSAENLVNGSICRTLGNTNYSDGDGSYYKIRTMTSGDVVDDDNIVALDVSNTLIAEKIPYSNTYEIYEDLQELTEDIEIVKNDRYVLIGDSYAYYRPDTQGIEGWQYPLQRILGLTDENCYKRGFNGGSFIGEPTFLQILQNSTIADHDTITKIVVCGGANETHYTQAQLETAIETFINYCKTEYPNAQVYIGCIGNYNTYGKISEKQLVLRNVLPAYKNCVKYGGIYLNGTEYIMNDYDNYYDNTHPNQNLCVELANNIYEALKTGSCNVTYSFNGELTMSNSPFSGITKLPFSENMVNNKVVLQYNVSDNYRTDHYTLTTPTNDIVVLGNMNFKYLRQRFNYQNLGLIEVMVTYADNSTEKTFANLYLQTDNEVYLWVAKHSNQNITKVAFLPFHLELDGIYY